MWSTCGVKYICIGSKEASSEAKSESATEAVSEAGESEESGEVSYPLTLTGTDGTEITINEEPEKIVSMGPNMTEILYAIGAGDKLVGRTDYCDYPAAVSELSLLAVFQMQILRRF